MVGAELWLQTLAHAVRLENRFEILKWNPRLWLNGNDIRKPKIKDLLTGTRDDLPAVPIYPTGYHLDYANEEARRERALWFYRTCVSGFYRQWWRFAHKYNTTKNIGGGFLMETLVHLYLGFRGSRTETGGTHMKSSTGNYGGFTRLRLRLAKMATLWVRKGMENHTI